MSTCCQPPRLCPLGQRLFEAEVSARCDLYETRRTRPNDYNAILDAVLRFVHARHAYNAHINMPDAMPTLDMALRGVFGLNGHQEALAIVRAEMVRLYRAAGEPLPPALGGPESYTINASGLVWTDEQCVYATHKHD